MRYSIDQLVYSSAAFSRVLHSDGQVHTMMEESAAACVSEDFSQALEKAKEAVSQVFPQESTCSTMVATK